MKQDEKGIALVITLFLMATLSALAVSMMFLAQTETASSRNYRTMSQARYAAEAGVHEMANYLMYTWTAPLSPFAGYDATRVPVTCTNGCTNLVNASGTCDGSTIAKAVTSGCIVIGYSAATSNNPGSTINSGASGTLATNSTGTTLNGAMGTVTYGAAAILMSIQNINVYGGQPAAIERWQIISDGTVPPSTVAIVEVSTTLEREVGQAQAYAVFASSGVCGAIDIEGSASTDSFSSIGMTTLPPPAGGSLGGVGTNGNLYVGGSVTINGTLSTPRTGAGTCSNSSPDAITGSGHRWSYNGTNKLSQGVVYDTPTIPSSPKTSITIQSSDGTAGCQAKLVAALSTGWTCTVSSIPVANTLTLTPTSTAITSLTLGNLTVGSNTNLMIAGGAIETLNVNSFGLGSNATMTFATGTSVVMNIAGQNPLGSTNAYPLDLSGGGTVNTTYDPSRLQIIYPGPGQINVVGNNTVAATIYAPNALAYTTGAGNVYGAILAGKFTDTGGAQIHFDSALTKKFSTLGDFMLTSFSWKKY
jgi:Tfp pilus assembly protein PilX